MTATETAEEKLVRSILEAIADDSLRLPTLPDIAVRIQRMARDPEVTAARLAAEISRDVATTARLLKIVNSASQRGTDRIDNLTVAVARLGINVSCNMVVALLLGQMFQATTPVIDQILRNCWKRSQEVAALSHTLAASHTKLNPELAMIAGLTYEIGMLAILRLADATPEISSDAAALERILHKLQARVGSVVLKIWGFPADIVDVPLHMTSLYRDHAGPADYADVVTVAVLRCGASNRTTQPIDEHQRIPALEKLNIREASGKIEVNWIS